MTPHVCGLVALGAIALVGLVGLVCAWRSARREEP